jgi:hypothetical protein
MRRTVTAKGSGLVFVCVSAFLSVSVNADTVVPLAPCAANAAGCLPSSVTYTNGSAQVTGSPGASGGLTTYTLSPGTYTYGQSFNTPLTPFTPPGGGAQRVFFTDYVFTIAANQVDSLSSSINLGTNLAINGLSARLYEYSVGATQNLTLPAFMPTGQVLDGWSTAQNLAPGLTAQFSVIAPTTLDAGTYVLEMTASSVGSSGGSYTGSLNITPVPLPAALPLALSGIAAVGAFVRRRRQSPSTRPTL